jgi:hypothetical protein
MEILVIVAKNSLYASTSYYKMLNVSFQSFQVQKIKSFKRERIYLRP